MNDKTQDILFKAALVVAAYFFVVRPLMQKLNIIDDQADKNILQNATSSKSPFDPNYYLDFPGGVLLTNNATEFLARKIYDAPGYFNDDEESVYGQFRLLRYKTQVSWLAKKFQAMFGKDLYNYLRSFMNETELEKVNQIVKELM